jgi:hypothetical protein
MPLTRPTSWRDILGTTPGERWGVDPGKMLAASPEMTRLVNRTAQLPPSQVMMAVELYIENGRFDLAEMFLGLAEQDTARLKLHAEVEKRRRGQG